MLCYTSFDESQHFFMALKRIVELDHVESITKIICAEQCHYFLLFFIYGFDILPAFVHLHALVKFLLQKKDPIHDISLVTTIMFPLKNKKGL